MSCYRALLAEKASIGGADSIVRAICHKIVAAYLEHVYAAVL